MALLLALLVPAFACPHLDAHEGQDEAVCESDAPARGATHLRFTETFLPTTVAHDLRLRTEGERDAYFSAELRYAPTQEWVGRLGAGFDVFGQGPLDLTLGVFLGAGGTWDEERARLASGPAAGTAVGIGYTGDRLFGRYRWLAGLDGGSARALLTENELTVGYRFSDALSAFGQYVVLTPRADRPTSGVGIGAQLTF